VESVELAGQELDITIRWVEEGVHERGIDQTGKHIIAVNPATSGQQR